MDVEGQPIKNLAAEYVISARATGSQPVSTITRPDGVTVATAVGGRKVVLPRCSKPLVFFYNLGTFLGPVCGLYIPRTFIVGCFLI